MLSDWVRRSFHMTATIDEKFKNIKNLSTCGHPSSKYYTSIDNKEEDQYLCQMTLQYHECSSYCLQKSTTAKELRWCNKTCSHEKTSGQGDTSGYKIINKPVIIRDPRGYNKLELPRNHPRVIQTSMFLVQGWRANVDIQLLLYDDNITKTTASDVAQISDYIISYICKGTETSVQEKLRVKDIILNSSECTGDIADVKRVSRHILNEATKNRLISKQESMCYIGQLPLFLCSEIIENISLSGYRKIGTQQEAQTTFLITYAKRQEKHEMSLHQYFDYKK